MADAQIKQWREVQTVELGAPASKVWEVVGGFYTIHKWHPDITQTEIVPQQTEIHAIRRLLTFPGQPKTTEQLIMMDNEGFHYRYRWYSGDWGEKVQDYFAEIRVFEIAMGKKCIVQWSSTFRYTEDALSQFYWNGFNSLLKMFPVQEEKHG
jgi:hypothetical protein